MDQDEKRWQLTIALAPIFVKAFRGDEFDVTSSKPKALWDTVDTIVAAETKPAEAPSDDGSRRIDPEYHPTIADYRVALMQLDELEARAEAAEKDADAIREGWRESAALNKARIAAYESREADARACARWLSGQDTTTNERQSLNGRTGYPEALAAARRYLAGEPSPKAAPDPAKACPRCQCELTPGSAHAWRTEDTCYVVSATATAAPVPPPDNLPAARVEDWRPVTSPAPKTPSVAIPRANEALRKAFATAVSDAEAWADATSLMAVFAKAFAYQDARAKPDNPPAPRAVQLDEFAAALRKDIADEIVYSHNAAIATAADVTQTYRRVLKWLDKRVAEAAATPKPPSASMERLREAVIGIEGFYRGARAEPHYDTLLVAARAVLAETDGGG